MPPTTRRGNPVVIELSDDNSSDDEYTAARNDRLNPLEVDDVDDSEEEDEEEPVDFEEEEAEEDDNDEEEDFEEIEVQEVDGAQLIAEEVDFTEQDCLDKVLEMFPNIAHDHVRQLYRERPNIAISGSRWCQQMINRILESGDTYPREKREDRKRKRSNSSYELEEFQQWGNTDREVTGSAYSQTVNKVLSEEFADIPVQHIREVVRREKTLFCAFQVLEIQDRNYESMTPKPFKKLQHSRIVMKRMRLAGNNGEIVAELAAAKKKTQKEAHQREEKAKKEKLEAENELEARATGAMADCACCFTESPINRMVHCNGETPHLFCYDCAKQNVATDIGSGKCRPKCMDQSGCKAGFTRSFLQQILDSKTFEKLELMQQEEDIRLAELDDVESCPFCEFKAVCPPVQVDKEFRCGNKECEKVSCRLCHEPTHIPKTCEEMKKEKKIDIRHQVEEAMTEGLIRSCNKCKNRFVKEFGCNKMTCPSCMNIQCYVCNKSIRNYEHFGNGPGKCPLHDNTDQRHQEDVKRAEAVALAKIRADHPELTDDDLKVKVSARVQQAEAARVQQGFHRPAPPAIFQLAPPLPGLAPPVPALAAGLGGVGGGVPGPAFAHAAVPPPFGAPPPAYPGLPGYFMGAPQMPPAPLPFGGLPPPMPGLGGHAGLPAPPPYYGPMGIADPIGARVAGALGNLYAANQRVQHELQAAERQLHEQRMRVQRWQDDIARYELEQRRRRHF